MIQLVPVSYPDLANKYSRRESIDGRRVCRNRSTQGIDREELLANASLVDVPTSVHRVALIRSFPTSSP
jgi:hypothetical protein